MKTTLKIFKDPVSLKTSWDRVKNNVTNLAIISSSVIISNYTNYSQKVYNKY